METYANTLLRNIGKIFVIPHARSTQYLRLRTELLHIMNEVKLGQMDRQQAAIVLHEMFSTMTRVEAPKENRVEERISNIITLMKPRNFSPRTILDVGAGKGDITTALKIYYNLPSSDVFAIDQKLPEVAEITPLTYIDGKIPLSDNSIDLIIIFVVLHHIPPDVRPNIMSEISRVLSPNGVVIIREHDNDGTQDFYVFLDLMHLLWYLAFKETPDPLYLLSRAETQNLFKDAGLESSGYITYPEPNPQHLYHEMFTKKQNIGPYKFADANAQIALQSYMNKIRTAPATYESFATFLPQSIQLELNIKYHASIQTNIAAIWPEIVRHVALVIILESAKYSNIINGTRYITSDSINLALKSML